MTRERCGAPLDLARLLAYWFGESAPDETRRVEAHFLGCGECAGRLEELVALGAGIRAAFVQGAMHAVISAPLLARMRDEGLRLREYPVAAGQSVPCSIAADDDAVVSRLRVGRVAASRLDLIRTDESGAVQFRLQDIPFDPDAGEVLFCPSAAALKKLPAHTERLRLLAVDDSGERLLGEYTFVHTPA